MAEYSIDNIDPNSPRGDVGQNGGDSLDPQKAPTESGNGDGVTDNGPVTGNNVAPGYYQGTNNYGSGNFYNFNPVTNAGSILDKGHLGLINFGSANNQNLPDAGAIYGKKFQDERDRRVYGDLGASANTPFNEILDSKKITTYATPVLQNVNHFGSGDNKNNPKESNNSEKIVISGSEYPPKRYRLNFILPAMKLLETYSRKVRQNQSLTWLVFQFGYTGKQLGIMRDWADKHNVKYVAINSANEVVRYINSGGLKSESLSEDRKNKRIKRITLFSHGLPNVVSFGYGNLSVVTAYEFKEEHVNRLSPEAFFSDAFLLSYACRTGAGRDVWAGRECLPKESLAQKIANRLNIKVYAFQSRVEYKYILGTIYERHIKWYGHLTDRDVNGDTWFRNLNLIHYPQRAETPTGSDGLTLFQKNKEPIVLEHGSDTVRKIYERYEVPED